MDFRGKIEMRSIKNGLKIVLVGLLLFGGVIGPADFPTGSLAAAKEAERQNNVPSDLENRKWLFEQMELLTGIPWYRLAAIDQYERSLSTARPKKRPLRKGEIAILFDDPTWAGPLNPDPAQTEVPAITLFSGLGRDGDGDGHADRNSDLDVLYSMASYLLKYGSTEDQLRKGIWEYYRNPRSVQRIDQFAKLYDAFGTLDLFDHAFPLPLGAHYTYRDTWGASRGWGGRRMHEGTDIFADYGVPVRSTSYGIVELKGWNRYGGWRVGIRDLNGVYHYYAHLSGFAKDLKTGDIVKPGQVIGWVGSSGYGKPGTQGRFPPHLHYGMYRDYGTGEWAFDPYPYLARWEREERKNRSK
jgi:murein DD-endopeptidase MepM/ murein hydrolase activator NlpD